MSTVAEIWKPVVGYDGIYEVSSHGSIRSLDRIDHRGWQRKGQPMALCNYARKRRARACLACNKAQRFIAHRPELSDELQGVSDYFHGLIMSGQFRQGGAA